MSVQTQIDRISGAVQSALAALTEKGVTVPSGTKVDGLAALIAAIEAGGGSGGGGVEVSVGKIVPASNVPELTWEHGLSTAPTFIQLWMPVGYTPGTNANLLRSYYKQEPTYGNTIAERKDVYATKNSNLTHESSTGVNDKPWTITNASVTAGSCVFSGNTRNFVSGIPYLWLCVAGDIVFPK